MSFSGWAGATIQGKEKNAPEIAASPDAYPVGKAWEPERAGPDASREPKCVSDPAPVIEFRNCVMRYGHPDSPKSVTFRVL